MRVGIRCLVPPRTGGELTETDKVDAAAAFGKELTSSLVEHLIHVELGITLRRIEHFLQVLLGIVAAAH